jgi:predicted RNase H-like HicB family nuclease
MLTSYPACFYKEKDGGFSVIFPDLHHLSTCGDNLQEALTMATDCLAGYLYECRLSKEKVPAPSDLKKINLTAEYQDYAEAFVNIVSVDVESYAREHFTKVVKKTLTIPKILNDMAVAQDINFSQLLQEALIKKLHLDRKVLKGV